MSTDEIRMTLRGVLFQLEHGEASEGDKRDIAWCARSLREVLIELGGQPIEPEASQHGD